MQEERNVIRENAYTYCFHNGVSNRAYEYFGVHFISGTKGRYRYSFRTYSKEANAVYVVGDFIDGKGFRMNKITPAGIWEATYDSDIPIEGMRYCYRVDLDDSTILQCDPYSQCSEFDPCPYSIIRGTEPFEWSDKKVYDLRRELFYEKNEKHFTKLNIYEINGGKTSINYREIAAELSIWLRSSGYNYLELDLMDGKAMGDCFYPPLEYGSPDDFKAFVNALHRAEICLIIEWDPNEPLFSHFDLDRKSPEFRSFVISAALFWLREFHIDGFCMKNFDDDFFEVIKDMIISEFPNVLIKRQIK